MKHIIIKSCKDCHLKESRGESSIYTFVVFCTNKLTYGCKIKDLNDIPDWCMLDDIEGE